MRKTQKYLLAGAFICIAMESTVAQSIRNEVQILEASYGIEKRQIISQTMNLSGQEALDFWLIYDDYEDERRRLGEERLLLTHDYMIAYPSLSDAKASEIATRCFKNDEALARLHKQYYKKIKKALSPLKAAQFVQVEGYLQNVVRIQIQSQLPFIGELVPTVKTTTDK
jgi:hypothetical protein